MSLAPGTRLGPYEILSPIGAGGMGEVYKAMDSRLDRIVAIKISKEQFSERFAREARAVAALNHPNICTLHDVGPDYLVMEYIEGAPLKGPIPLALALKYAAQICDALDAAHSKNIIHRDLKPANILVNKSGIKLLDFGLAKVNPAGELLDDAATRSAPLTAEQSVVGTLQYMSPEQLEGKPVGPRSDIFAFGSVLYEMVTGKRAFQGSSQASIIAAILERGAPSIADIASPALELLLARCLAKDPDDRWQSMRDLKYELDQIAITGSGSKPSAPSPQNIQPHRNRIWSAILGVAILATAGIGVWIGHNVHPNQKSIAVLPFVNMSADKDQEYFSDGLAEELLSALTSVPGLQVAARTSSFQFKGKTTDSREIGKKLHVATILEGTVRKQDNHARIEVRLINTADGFNIWSQQYDRELNDIIDVQAEIAQGVTAALQVKLLGEKTAPSAPKSGNVDAYNAFLQGEYFRKRVSKANLEKAQSFLERAVLLDPKYAQARASLGMVFSIQAGFALIPTEEGYRKAREQIDQALRLDPRLVPAYTARAWIQMGYDWDWAGAAASYQQARQLEPGNAYVITGTATLAFILNHLDEAISLYRQSLGFDPLNAAAHRDFALILHYAGQQDEAIAEVKRALDLAPDIHDAHRCLARIYLSQSRPRDALAEAEKETFAPHKIQGLALVNYALGQKAESDTKLAELIEVARVTGPYQIAEVFAFRGEKDKAFEWLDRAYQERDGGLTTMKGDPLLKNLEQDPRFPAFLKKMRLLA